MTGREKIEAAFSTRGTVSPAVVIPYEYIFIRDHWDELTSCPWWYTLDPMLEHQLEWRRDAIAQINQDWFHLPLGMTSYQRDRFSIRIVDNRPLRVDHKSGAELALHPPVVGGWHPMGGVESVHPETMPLTEQDIRNAIPVPQDSPDQRVAKGAGDLPRLLLEEFGDELYPLTHVPSPLWSTYNLWGYEGMMAMVAGRPDLVRVACEAYLEQALWHVELVSAIGARGVWVEECLTDQVSPGAFADLCLPYVERIVSAIRDNDMHSIYYYCGDPSDRWDMLLDAGADALSLEESKKGFTIDIEEVAARAAGRVALLGNLDAMAVLEHATDEELQAEVRRQLEAGRANRTRFVASLGSPVTPNTLPNRVTTYCDMVREAGW